MRSFITSAALALSAAAAHAAPAVIDADTTLGAHHVGSVVVTADGVTLDCAGFTVQGDGTEAIGIDVQADGVTVTGCIVDRFTEAGLDAGDVDRLTVRGGGASRSDFGLRIQGGEGHIVDGFYVTTSRIGAHIADVRDASVGGITADGATEDGIRFWRAVDSELSNALVLRAGGTGLSIRAGYRSVVRAVEVVEAGDRGIFAWLTARLRIEDCTSRSNGHNGFGLYRNAHLTLTGNTAVGNTGKGINVVQSTAVTLDGNSTRGSGAAGFGQQDSDQVTGAGNDSANEIPLLIQGVPQPDLGALGQ